MATDLERAELTAVQQEADKLGIPWDLDWPISRLRFLIAKKKGITMSKPTKIAEFKEGHWNVYTDLPNGLQFVEGGFTNNNGDPPPPCFCEMWNAAGGDMGSMECKNNCDFEMLCKEGTAKIGLLQALEHLGVEASLPEIAQELSIDEESAKILMDIFAKECFETSEKKVQDSDFIGSIKKKKKPPKQVIENPTQPQSVDVAEVSVKTELGKTVKSAKARAGNCVDPFQREREKNKLLAKIQPGATLSVKRLGKQYQVRVWKDSYEYQHKAYPTLQKATNAAAGTQIRNGKTMCNWSATEFWKLKKLTPQK